MNDRLSFETAKTLKEMGFPEPKFSTGQLWYNEFGVLTFIGHQEGKEFYCHSLRNGRTEKMYVEHGEGTYFCPTATDILKEIKRICDTKKGYSFEIRFSPTIDNDGWQCDVFEDLPFDAMKPIWEIDSNPHEAAAQAYINWKRNETAPTP